ncbi:ISSfl2 ORF [Escherichia coli]
MGDNGIVLVIRSSNSKNTLEEFHEFFGNFGNDSNLLIVFYVQIMPDDFVMQLHRF